jgi:hypothetical protein
MSNDINLFAGRRQSLEALRSQVRIVRITAVASLVSVGVAMAIMYALLRLSPMDALIAQEQVLIDNLGLLREKGGKVLLLADRMRGIDTILNSQGDIGETIGLFVRSLPSGVRVDTLALNKKTFTVSLSSPSLGPLQQVIDNKDAMIRDTKRFKKTTISSVIYDPIQQRYIVGIESEVL